MQPGAPPYNAFTTVIRTAATFVRANPDGAGIVQAIGPMKALVKASLRNAGSKKFLIVTVLGDTSQVVLREGNVPAVR